MSGWRHFGMDINGKPEFHARLLKEDAFNKDGNMRIVDGFLCAELFGYGKDPGLVDLLKNTEKVGYYFEMNDTTDTASGVIRFKEGEPLIDVIELVDYDIEEEEEVYDGYNSSLSHFQMKAPGTWSVYNLLSEEGIPYLGDTVYG